MPADCTTPMLMVGPGTGVAPFRAFTQTQAHQRADGRVIGDSLLFVGCRHPDHDYLYRDEWARYVEGGALRAVHPAFSRIPGGRLLSRCPGLLDVPLTHGLRSQAHLKNMCSIKWHRRSVALAYGSSFLIRAAMFTLQAHLGQCLEMCARGATHVCGFQATQLSTTRAGASICRSRRRCDLSLSLKAD